MPRTTCYTNRVNILKYVKAGKGWRFAAVVEKKGKPVRDHVRIAQPDRRHPGVNGRDDQLGEVKRATTCCCLCSGLVPSSNVDTNVA